MGQDPLWCNAQALAGESQVRQDSGIRHGVPVLAQTFTIPVTPLKQMTSPDGNGWFQASSFQAEACHEKASSLLEGSSAPRNTGVNGR